MGCDAGDACVHDHVLPYLRQPKPGSDGQGYRALAPCHRDTEHSLSVSAGDSGRVIWHCFAGCGSEQVREALIGAGVPSRCLTRPAPDLRDREDAIRAIVHGKDSHAHARLKLAAILAGYDGLPKGDALEALAESCGVSMREAYRARQGQAP